MYSVSFFLCRTSSDKNEVMLPCCKKSIPIIFTPFFCAHKIRICKVVWELWLLRKCGHFRRKKQKLFYITSYSGDFVYELFISSYLSSSFSNSVNVHSFIEKDDGLFLKLMLSKKICLNECQFATINQNRWKIIDCFRSYISF
jgi:hypothetical protein